MLYEYPNASYRSSINNLHVFLALGVLTPWTNQENLEVKFPYACPQMAVGTIGGQVNHLLFSLEVICPECNVPNSSARNE